jgi:addiction module HigA family antidote
MSKVVSGVSCRRCGSEANTIAIIEHIARDEKIATADTALRLGKFFKTGAAFWMNIQTRFDLETAEDVLAPQITNIVAYKAA